MDILQPRCWSVKRTSNGLRGRRLLVRILAGAEIFIDVTVCSAGCEVLPVV